MLCAKGPLKNPYKAVRINPFLTSSLPGERSTGSRPHAYPANPSLHPAQLYHSRGFRQNTGVPLEPARNQCSRRRVCHRQGVILACFGLMKIRAAPLDPWSQPVLRVDPIRATMVC